MDDDSDFSGEGLLVSVHWDEETGKVSLAASGLLSALVRAAAKAGTTEIPVSAGNVAPSIHRAADRDQVVALIAELRLAGLLRLVRPGVFAVAPGLWKVGRWQPGDKDYVPLV